jgi:hypothetical protein
LHGTGGAGEDKGEEAAEHDGAPVYPGDASVFNVTRPRGHPS